MLAVREDVIAASGNIRTFKNLKLFWVIMSANISEALRWLETLLGQDLKSKQCKICQRLFEGLRDGVWDGKPLLVSIHASGKEGCQRCSLIWTGVISAFPDVRDWNATMAHGLLVAENVHQFLRVGVKGPWLDDVPGAPRHWVDFHIGENAGMSMHLQEAISRVKSFVISQVFYDAYIFSLEYSNGPRFSAPLPNSDNWYRMVETWITTCDTKHGMCQSRGTIGCQNE